MNVFKAYDIRGLAPQEIDNDFAFSLGLAINKVNKLKKVLVGRDMRVTSLDLEKSLIESFLKQGIEVVKIGLCSTPMFNVLIGLPNWVTIPHWVSSIVYKDKLAIITINIIIP